jgi:hypothetical protein
LAGFGEEGMTAIEVGVATTELISMADIASE